MFPLLQKVKTFNISTTALTPFQSVLNFPLLFLFIYASHMPYLSSSCTVSQYFNFSPKYANWHIAKFSQLKPILLLLAV